MAFWFGRLTRSIWRGPFYVGPLVRPVSTGDAILKVMETIWRFIVIFFVLGVVAAIFLIFMILWENTNRQPSISDIVKVSVVQNRKVCIDPAYPLLVKFDNPSHKTVKNIHFTIVVQEQGHSNNLNAELASRESDQIIPPKSFGTQCWSKPDLKAQPARPLVYSANIDYGSWQE